MKDIARPVSRFAMLLPSMAAMGLLGCSGGSKDEPAPAVTADGAVSPEEDSNIVVPPEEDSGVDPGADGGTPTAETGTPAPEYPPGPYGKTLGATIPNLSWKGYRDGTGEWTDIRLGDYYDPAGDRGYRAIKIGMAALW